MQHLPAYVFLLSLAWGGALAAQSAGTCGDCDGNGLVQILDSLLAAQHDAGIVTIQSPELEACDVQSFAGAVADVDVLDALRIAQHLVALVVVLDCSIPASLWIEEFDVRVGMDAAATTADWGLSRPGALTAGRSILEARPFAAAAASSSVPFRDGGARTQLLFRPGELGYAGGTLQQLQLYLGDFEEGGRTYTDLEVWICHTTVAALGSVFQANYAGATPVLVKPAATEVYGSGAPGEPLDLRIMPGSFAYNASDNLLVEILHRGASAVTVLQVDDTIAHDARVHSSDPLAISGFATATGHRVRLVFSGAYAQSSVGVSTFHDTGSVAPLYSLGSIDVVQPPGTSHLLWFEGAPDDGTGLPLQSAATGWLLGDSRLLSGYQFIRFKIELTATPLATPEVLRVRVPYSP